MSLQKVIVPFSLAAAFLFASPGSFAAEVKSSAVAHVLRFSPDEDPRQGLESYVKKNNILAASIVSAVGSLKVTTLRYANEKTPVRIEGFREVVSLSGTLGATSGMHLHLSVSDAKGTTLGGHWTEGSRVYTTLEVVLMAYPELEFQRVPDPKTTYDELVVSPIKKKTPASR